jgi:PHD/YefM family antitoxin component YafN of YafNO toxin-antitoxin module
MNVYTYSEARQKLASLLDQALKEGEVRIKRKDGRVFVVKPQAVSGSAFDIEGLDLNLSTSEILAAIHEGRGAYQAK